MGKNYEWIVKLPVQKVSLDFVYGNNLSLVEKYGFPSDKTLGAGVVDGRSVFKDSKHALNTLEKLESKVKDIHVGTSCSLQFCP